MNIIEAHSAILSGKTIDHCGFQYKLIDGTIYYSTDNWKTYSKSDFFDSNNNDFKVILSQEEIDKNHFKVLYNYFKSHALFVYINSDTLSWLSKKASS